MSSRRAWALALVLGCGGDDGGGDGSDEVQLVACEQVGDQCILPRTSIDGVSPTTYDGCCSDVPECEPEEWVCALDCPDPVVARSSAQPGPYGPIPACPPNECFEYDVDWASLGGMWSQGYSQGGPGHKCILATFGTSIRTETGEGSDVEWAIYCGACLYGMNCDAQVCYDEGYEDVRPY